MSEPDHPMWHVFVSHSTKGTDGVAKRLLDKLIERLPPNYKVVVDQEGIHAGDDWEEWIRDALAESHLAIILLDEKAMRSDWVRRESTALTVLHKFDDHVIPVFIGVSTDDVGGHPDFKYLRRRQAIKKSPLTGNADADAEWFYSSIAQRLSPSGQGMYKEDVLLSRELAGTFAQKDKAQGHINMYFKEYTAANGDAPFFPDERLANLLLEDKLGQSAVRAISAIAIEPSRIRQARPIMLSSWITWPEAQPIRLEDPPAETKRELVLFKGDSQLAKLYVFRAYGCEPSIVDDMEDDSSQLTYPADGNVDSFSRLLDRLFGQDGKDDGCELGEAGKCVRHSHRSRNIMVEVTGGIGTAAGIIREIHERCQYAIVILVLPPNEYGHLTDQDLGTLLQGSFRKVKKVNEERSCRYYRNKDRLDRIFRN